MGLSSGLRLIWRRAGSSCIVGKSGEEAVEGPLEVGDPALGPLGQAHVLEPVGVEAALLPREVREVLGGDGWPARIVVVPRLGRRGLLPLLALGEPGERPDLHQRLLGTERAEPVGRGTAVHGQDEVVREAVPHRLVEALRLEFVEVGDVAAPTPVPVDDGVVERPLPGGHGQLRVSRQLDVPQALGDGHVVGVDHPGHAVAHGVQIVELRVDQCLGVDGPAVARWEPPGDDQLGMGFDDVVLLHERLLGQLPVDRKPAGVPPLRLQRLHLPGVEDGGERLDALPQRRGTGIEVDPGAPAPHLAPHRGEVDVLRLQVVLGERLPLGDEGVLAVGAVAPAVEWADEAALARAPALDDLDATMAAGVLEGADPEVLVADHDDGLIEDLVLGEVVGLGDLLEPAGHLPDPRPEQIDLHLEEVRVEVALLWSTVSELHGVGHRKCRPSPIRDRHAAPFPLGVRF